MSQAGASAFRGNPRLQRFWRFLRPLLIPEWAFNRKVEVTRPGYVFLVLILAIGFASFNTGNNLLYLVLSMMIAGLFFSFTLSEWMIAKVRIERDLPETVTEGESFRIPYRVVNRNRLVPALALRLSEKLGAGEVMALAAFVSARREVKVRGLAIAPRRGRQKFHDLTLATAAPFGWFRKSKRIPLAGELVVLPRADVTDTDREKLASAGEEQPQNRRGRGNELFGFRDYLRGDPVKDIHWKTTARLGRHIVREREIEDERRLRIVLGLAPARPDAGDPDREEAVRRAAGLAAVAIEEGFQVRIEVQDKGVDFGAGPAHLLHLLLFLALFDDPQAPAGDLLPLSNAPALVVS